MGYSLGDMAANLVYRILMAFQFVFFSEILGLSSAAVGTVSAVAGLVRAAVCGHLLADLHEPGWEPTMQMVYAYVMYFLLMAVYTVNNVPYCALKGVMTADIDERTTLSSYRFVAVTVAQLIVQVFTWPLVAKLGQDDDARGWSLTIGIFAVITLFLFVVSLCNMR